MPGDPGSSDIYVLLQHPSHFSAPWITRAGIRGCVTQLTEIVQGCHQDRSTKSAPRPSTKALLPSDILVPQRFLDRSQEVQLWGTNLGWKCWCCCHGCTIPTGQEWMWVCRPPHAHTLTHTHPLQAVAISVDISYFSMDLRTGERRRKVLPTKKTPQKPEKRSHSGWGC